MQDQTRPLRNQAWPWRPVVAARAPCPTLTSGLQVVTDALHLPFDVMRAQHAQAVRAGLLARSMLESRDFERHVNALEHLTLGPFARQV